MTPRIESRHDRCITGKASDAVRGNSRASTPRSETKTFGFAVLRDGGSGERSGSLHHRAMSHSKLLREFTPKARLTNGIARRLCESSAATGRRAIADGVAQRIRRNFRRRVAGWSSRLGGSARI
jgi:hypothetical protein